MKYKYNIYAIQDTLNKRHFIGSVAAGSPSAALKKAKLYEGFVYRLSRKGIGYTNARILVYEEAFAEFQKTPDFILERII